ncbi:hypothetical protein DPEC_G00046910 [Dallia pectoralis]|uniref:Uncharacterized protein n=1 Tax=Dallia pectoralis TaxID=75939 RepID=A0ACC2HAC9_DALPE|nr:hypothetical protein DPEC_G00373920 [Dallia pectoralis]KAJ8012826.1 hypothetical protein DPEC_G00046910 [Dallia pectoralis]
MLVGAAPKPLRPHIPHIPTNLTCLVGSTSPKDDPLQEPQCFVGVDPHLNVCNFFIRMGVAHLHKSAPSPVHVEQCNAPP